MIFKDIPDVVIVGSWVLKVNGLMDRAPNDIDVVVKSKDSLKRLGDVRYFKSNSPIANGYLRGGLIVENTQIDIWVEPELPDYDIIKGLKFKTLDSYFKWYEELLNRTDKEIFVTLAKEKLKLKNK